MMSAHETCRRRLPLAVVVVVAAALLASVSPAAASWDPSLCVWGKQTVTIHKYGDYSRWKLRRAIREWNSVSAGQPKFRLVTTGTADVTIRKINDTSAPYDGIEHHWCGGSGAYDSQVRINTAWHPHISARGRELTVLHELGHSLGLGHSFSEYSVMCYCYPYESRDAAPTATDAHRLRDLYLLTVVPS